MDTGMATGFQVVLDLEYSLEYQINAVQGLYQRFLGRAAEPLGLTTWVGFLADGGTTAQLEAMILGSPEYFNVRGGGTAQGFINAVYDDVLGRSPDPGGAMFYSQLLANGSSPFAVAQALLTSSEDDLIRLRGYYQQFLRRDIDPTGQTDWGNSLARGVPDEMVIAAIVASTEYLERFHVFQG